jgi:signal transduction histidine kinase/pSer/pThr/pTyr-binding forkhead associated (FHA) protein
MFKLLIKTGEEKGKSYPIRDSVVLIGRDSSNTITLPDKKVSRKHASISPQGSEFLIEDLGSANGTMVNNRPVRQQILKPGDEVRMGSTLLEFAILTDEDGPSEDLKDDSPMVLPASDRDPAKGSTVQLTLRPRELESLVALPDQAEPSILQKAYLRLAVMCRLINDLVTMTDLGELMDRTAEMVLEIIKADRALLMLVDGESGELSVQATRQRKGLKSDDEISFSKTISRRVFETGESILTSDAMKDDRFQSSDSIILHRIRSTLCVPIKTKDRILGIIHVDTLEKVMGFSQEELELLAAMGHQIGIAVENAKLVTDLKKANVEIKDQQAKLIEAEKLTLLGKIAGGVAHEINNPIMSILGFTGMACKRLQDAVPAPEKVNECIHYLNVVQEEAHRCIQIVESISQFYRRKQSAMAPIRIEKVIEAALSIAKLHMNQGHIEIVTHLSPDLPPILANQGLLQQVLVNILLNARDAMEKGGVLSVATGFENPPWVTIRISDTGCGIKPEDIQRIFTPLFTTKGEGKGTGLGLSISQDIIKSHNGAIEVESVPGKGTTFIIRLPSANQSSSACAG